MEYLIISKCIKTDFNNIQQLEVFPPAWNFPNGAKRALEIYAEKEGCLAGLFAKLILGINPETIYVRHKTSHVKPKKNIDDAAIDAFIDARFSEFCDFQFSFEEKEKLKEIAKESMELFDEEDDDNEIEELSGYEKSDVEEREKLLLDLALLAVIDEKVEFRNMIPTSMYQTIKEFLNLGINKLSPNCHDLLEKIQYIPAETPNSEAEAFKIDSMCIQMTDVYLCNNPLFRNKEPSHLISSIFSHQS